MGTWNQALYWALFSRVQVHYRWMECNNAGHEDPGPGKLASRYSNRSGGQQV